MRQIIRDAGVDPDYNFHHIIPRNKEFYKRWKQGESFSKIAKDFNKSLTVVSITCKRIEYCLKKGRGRFFEVYKDLLKTTT